MRKHTHSQRGEGDFRCIRFQTKSPCCLTLSAVLIADFAAMTNEGRWGV